MKVNDFVKTPNGQIARVINEYYQSYTVLIISGDQLGENLKFNKNELEKYELKVNFNQIKEIIGYEFVKSLTYEKNNFEYKVETINYVTAFFAFIESQNIVLHYTHEEEKALLNFLINNSNASKNNFKKITNYSELVDCIIDSDTNLFYNDNCTNEFDDMALKLIKLLEE